MRLRAAPILTSIGLPALLFCLPAVGTAQEEVTPSAVRSVLARFDEAFNARDLEACMELFESENAEVMAAMRDRLADVLTMPRQLVQESALEGELQRVGPRTVATVCVVHRPHDDGASAASVTDWSYFVFKSEGNRAVPVMAVDFEYELLGHIKDGRFTCTPCNYSIGGLEGWLAVPLPPERTNVMEAVSFFLLGTDLTFDMSVHIEPGPEAPLPALERLVEDLGSRIPDLTVEVRGNWTPPSVPAAERLEGAHARLTFADGREHWLYLCTMGVMRYLMIARGHGETLRQRARDLRAMLSSFMLKDPDITLNRLSEYPLLRHTGGRFVDRRYENGRYHLELTGPEDWTPGQRSGAFLFHVQYCCPDGEGGLWMTGYHNRAPGSDTKRAFADRMLKDMCRSSGLVVDVEGDGGWQAPKTGRGFSTRTVKTVPAPGSDRRPYMIRLAMRDEILVVLSGYVGSAGREKVLLEAFDSLQVR